MRGLSFVLGLGFVVASALPAEQAWAQASKELIIGSLTAAAETQIAQAVEDGVINASPLAVEFSGTVQVADASLSAERFEWVDSYTFTPGVGAVARDFTLPPGKTVVIEQVSVHVEGTFTHPRFLVTWDGPQFEDPTRIAWIPLQAQGADIFDTTHSVHLVVSAPSFRTVVHADGSDTPQVYFLITGYYIDTP